MACPRCGGELQLTDVFTGGRHATVARCAGCGGQWMRDTDLARLAEVIEPVMVEWRTLPSGAEQLAPLHCPECPSRPLLVKHRAERDQQVLVDTCAACGGVWLDGGELRALQQESLVSLLVGFWRSGSR